MEKKHTSYSGEKIKVLKDDFKAHIQSSYFEDYVRAIYPLIQTESIYEGVCERTKGGNLIVKDKILVPPLSRKELTVTEVFNGIESLINNHNEKYFNEGTKRGVYIETIKSKGSSSRARTLAAAQGGVERNVCLVPFIVGVGKPQIADFIMGVMDYRRILGSFVTDPSNPDYNVDPTKSFRTFCNRTDYTDFFYTDISFKRDLAVVLPSFNGKEFSRQIEEDDDNAIWNSPELQLLSIMAYYLKDNPPEIKKQLKTIENKIKETPTEIAFKKIAEDEKERKYVEKYHEISKSQGQEGDIPSPLNWNEEIKEIEERLRKSNQKDQPIQDPLLRHLTKYSIDELYDIFEPFSQNGTEPKKETLDNDYALCNIITQSAREVNKKESRGLIENSRDYWQRFFEGRVQEIKENGGFKIHKVAGFVQEKRWERSTINDPD